MARMRTPLTWMRAAAGAGLMLLCASAANAQDYYWESLSGPEDTVGQVSVTSFSPRKMKFVSGNPGDPVIIVRLDRQSVLVVNASRQSYAEIGFADWKNMRAQQSAWVVQVPPDIQQLPPEERNRRLQEVLAQNPATGARADVQRVPETKTIQGLACTKWIVKAENRIVLTVWATRAIREFGVMRGDLAECYRQLALNYPGMRYYAEALRSIDGFPMQYQADDTKTTVKLIQRRNWDDEEFQAPSGYRKTTPAIPGR